jgi:hypothetical protein
MPSTANFAHVSDSAMSEMATSPKLLFVRRQNIWRNSRRRFAGIGLVWG